MKQTTNEQEVIRLLTSLKNAESDYPSDLLRSRREIFIQQAAMVAAAMNTALEVKNDGGSAESSSSAASTASSSVTASMGTLLETILVVALVIEAGVAAYLFRDKIAQFFNSVFSPRVEQTVNPLDAVDISNTGDAILTETPNPTMTDPSAPADTFTITTPQNGGSNNNGASGSGGGNNNGTPGSGDSNNPPAVSTPQPTRPGLHLGQTPRPERTLPPPSKENNDN